MTLKAPFPWHGGKSRVAELIWQRLGRVDGFYEPFAGSLAVLLAAPYIAKREVVCDLSPHVSNFWRAMRDDPMAVAEAADYPTLHHDLIARQRYLNRWGIKKGDRLLDDPHYFDPEAAGWWAWGVSNWIGGSFADGWGNKKMDECVPFMSTPGGQGVMANGLRERIPHLKGSQGVNNFREKIPFLSSSGQGVNARIGDKRPVLKANPSGSGIQVQNQTLDDCPPLTGERLLPWFLALAERLKRVVVLRRGWESALTDTVTMRRDGRTAGVLLDPPYLTGDRHKDIYGSDNGEGADNAAKDSYDWAVKHGNDERFRIVYCAHEGDFEVPPGWTCHTSSFTGIRQSQRREKRQDMLMFSPHCVPDAQTDFFA